MTSVGCGGMKCILVSVGRTNIRWFRLRINSWPTKKPEKLEKSTKG